MSKTVNTFENFPDWLLKKWQDIADLLAEIIGIPAALIMKTENEFMEVFISSHSENNPYHVGEKEKWYGLYCETVIKTQNKLLIPNATKDKKWDKNPDIKLGMIAYLGFPINFPDNQPFGTLCVLDNKERPFTLLNEKLIEQFKNVIELDLALIQSYELKTNQLAATVVQEITERKRAEHALQERVKELKCIAEISRLAELPGISIEELVEKSTALLPSAWQYPEDACAQVTLDGTVFKTENFEESAWSQSADLHVYGQKIGQVTVGYLKEKPAADEGPFLKEERNILNVVADFLSHIIQHRRTEKQIKESEIKFRAIYDSANDGILLADLENKKFFDGNSMICNMLGYSLDEIQKLGVMDIHPERDLPYVIDQFEKQSRKEISIAKDIPVKRKDGSVFYAEVNAGPITLGNKSYLIGIFRDITERKRLEEEHVRLEAHLRQQQKLEAIGTLAGGVAHEINNPITGIMNYAQLIADAAPPESQTADYAGEIVRETERVATIVRNLLRFARQEKQVHSPARIADIIEQTLSLLRAVLRRDQITLEVDVPEGLPSLKCRSQQIQQVLMNLLTNARDALNEKYPGYHEDKTIAITVRVAGVGDQGPGVRAESVAEKRWIRVTVADRGNGIPAEIRDRIFDPFFTTKPWDQGTGLGLSISHGIVKDHGGALHFETEPGQGTRFHLDLPVAGDGMRDA